MDREPVTPATGLAGQGSSPAQRYRQIDLASRIEAASPHALVAMLYAELIAALDVFERTPPGPRRMQQHERATTILHSLEAGLDRGGGGDLAAALASIYRQMRRRLAAARGGDAGAIAEVRTGVESLAEAWARIA